MSPGVIVLAPPWPRSGSANVIAAQTAAHARRGARVFLLLTPLGRGHARGRASFWQDTVSAMTFPGVETVAYPRAGRRKARSYLQWLLAGRDDSIAVTARYAASGKLPDELAEFMGSTRIELIHANHVYAMRLARRIAGIVQASRGRRPPVLLDTHDVQSDVFAAGRRVNKHSGRVDSYDDLLRTELALCGHADTLVHLTQSDFAFFSSRLPRNAHALVLPTLHPHSEAELMRRRGLQREGGFDFAYVGTNHGANVETVHWMLREVFPRLEARVRERVRFIGRIERPLRRHQPQLFNRYRHLFLGEVPSLFEPYTAAKAVLAPATAGTGSSIKLIEALCVGKPILTTTVALRGLPRGEVAGEDIHVHDAAADFAEAMTRLSQAASPAPAASSANAALYDRLFSNECYFAALDGVVGRKVKCGTPCLVAE